MSSLASQAGGGNATVVSTARADTDEAARPPRRQAPTVSAPHQVRRFHATQMYRDLENEYSRSGDPVPVSFRHLVGPIPVNDLSHSVFPYPARLLRQIPRFFLGCEDLVEPGDFVLDPFCGSGTVLVEASAAGIDSWGIDSNPFARLLSRVKTTYIDASESAAALADTLSAAKRFRSGLTPDVVNVDTWFSPCVKGALSRIYRSVLEAHVSEDIRRYLLLSIALTADRCSLRDQRIPVPVRMKDWATVADGQNADFVWQSFETLGATISGALARVPQGPARTRLVGVDAASASRVFADELADEHDAPRLLLTSPPYGAAQKYIRSSSLALGWTGLATAGDLADLEAASIGREHLRLAEMDEIGGSTDAISADLHRIRTTDARRAAIYSHYFSQMEQVFVDAARLLPDGGHLVMVVGSNVVAGKTVNTPGHLRDLAVQHGFRTTLELQDEIRGRVLLTTRANSSQPLHSETVHVLRRVDR